MKQFYEKADSEIIEECKVFIKANIHVTADYSAYRGALHLFIKLSESLIASHKDFEETIKAETDKIFGTEASADKDFAVYRFNQANYRLILDAEAHHILNQLELIYKSYPHQ